MNRLRTLTFLLEAVLSLVSKPVALRGAIRRNDISDVAALLRKGVLKSPRLLKGAPPLVLASSLGRSRLVHLLVEDGADPCEHGGAAFRVAADIGSAPVIEALLVALRRARKEDGRLADSVKAALEAGLTSAARAGYVDLCRALLEAGASVDARDGGPRGYTSLMYASETGDLEVAQLLISLGANVNCVAVNGYSALMMAADKCHPQVVNALLSAGADRSLRNRHGLTAIDMAQFVGCDAAVALLSSRTE